MATRSGSHPLRVLFFLRGIHYGRVFENFLRAMLDRGHELHIALALEKRGFAENTGLFEELATRYTGFSYEQLEPRRGTWDTVAMAIRHALDYLRYLEPEYANADPLRERAEQRVPVLLRALLAFPFRGRIGRRLLGGMLGRIEAALPVPKHLIELVERRAPDVVLVSPLIGLGSIESDHVRAAEAAGVPTVLAVASWDNLSNKGRLRDVPTRTVVWNETQVDEAVDLHGLPREQVVAVGAHSFDHWFSWQPSMKRERFAERLGLDPERPIVLYLGSSYFMTADETVFVRDWLGRLRAHPRLAEAAVILRPHPYNIVGWAELDVDEPGKTAIWPRAGAVPEDRGKKSDYFDTLWYSSAVMGINTSALIEASILRRPVLTLLSDYFRTQDGTIHFSYIAHDDSGGVVTVGRSWDEHLDQLADAIEVPETYDERITSFVTQFIRPHGLDVAAAPAAVDAIEQTAATKVARRRAPILRFVLLALTPLVAMLLPLFQPRLTWKRLSKWFRLQVKRFRQWRKRRQRARNERAKAKKPAVAKAAKPGKPAKTLKTPKPETVAMEPKKKKPRPPEERIDELDLLVMTPEELAAERKRRRAVQRRQERADAKKKLTPDEVKAKKARAQDKVRARAAGEEPAKKKSKGKQARKRGPVAELRIRARKTRGRTAKRARRRWKVTKRRVRSVYNTRNRFRYRSKLTAVPSRDEIPALLNARKLTGRGVEIGVKTGRFSEHLLSKWRGEQLVSVDPWLSDDPEAYVDRANVEQDKQEEFFRETRERLAPFGKRSDIWRTVSVEAARKIPDRSLDFVYIDARHDYESVLEDLDAWYPKVKPGGILAGHDYADGMLPQGDFGVKSAVDEFFAARGIPVHVTEGPTAVEMFPSWVVEMPAAVLEQPARTGEPREAERLS